MIIERWNNYTFGVPLYKYISKKKYYHICGDNPRVQLQEVVLFGPY
jgi:hypothetical protein